MKKVISFVKKHAPALCACVLAGVFALSAVWLRASGVERVFLSQKEKAPNPGLEDKREIENKMHPPSAGDVLVRFSNEELSYNSTTRVYEIHAGTDFFCPDGKVFSVMDGRVEDVFYDFLWGNTIIVLHENGDKSLYASLSDVFVSKGNRVRAGDVIGKSGTSAAIEEKTGPHLHFEYIKNGKSYPISFTTAPEA